MDFEFEKSGTVQTLDAVPEQFRPFYAEAEGGYALDEKYKGVGKSIDGLNKSLKAARRDADEAKRSRPDLSGYAELGPLLGLEEGTTDPAALKEALETVLRQSKDGQVNWDKMKQQLQKSHQDQLGAKEKELGTMSATLQRYLVTSEAVRAIAEAKGVPELLLPQVQARTKVIKDGDNYVVRVVDDQGDPRADSSGGFMGIADLVKELKSSPVYGRAFESEAPNGTGTQPRNGNGVKPQQRQVERSSMDKIKSGLSKR